MQIVLENDICNEAFFQHLTLQRVNVQRYDYGVSVYNSSILWNNLNSSWIKNDRWYKWF